MRGFLRHRPSGAMLVAVMALVLAASGTAIAASTLVSGDKLIKKGTLSGNRLRKHTVTGKQVNLRKLGKVPNAKQADSATNATHATTADTATKATSATSATTATNASNAATAARSGAWTTAPQRLRLRPVCADRISRMPRGTFATGGGLASPSETTPATTSCRLVPDQ